MPSAVQNPKGISTFGLASSAFARHYLRNLGWFLFLALLRCFSSGGSPHTAIWFTACWLSFTQPGCPIRRSMDIASAYDSPWLFAVNRVLHRLPVPRHSPCALFSLTFAWFLFENLCLSFSLVKYCNYYPISFLCLSVFTDRQLSSLLILLSSLFSFQGTILWASFETQISIFNLC